MENKGRGWYNKNRYCKKITDLEYIEAEEYCMDQQVKRVKRELVKNGAILDIYTDTMQLPDGKLEEWDFISHRKGAAAVVPVRGDGKILMVRQYRNAIDRMTLEIPAGSRDSVTEDTKVCAARELEEETGYRSDDLTRLLSLKTTVAFCDEFIDVYLARNLKPGHQHLDEGEFLDVEAHDIDELCQMIYDGKLLDAKTVSALLEYKNLLNQEKNA